MKPKLHFPIYDYSFGIYQLYLPNREYVLAKLKAITNHTAIGKYKNEKESQTLFKI